MDYAAFKRVSRVTLGKEPADLVLKGAKVIDVFTNEMHTADLGKTMAG